MIVARFACILLLLALPLAAQQTSPVSASPLAKETTPYLARNAASPVMWMPWGDAAIARAKREAKPIFLTIGYASCHPCHEMERDVFGNGEIAEMINMYFVPVLVDREEAPALDAIFTTIVQSSSWPKIALLTPDLQPIVASTAMKPGDVSRLLVIQSNRWASERHAVVAEAAANVAKARGAAIVAIPERPSSPDALRELAKSSVHDQLGGGFHRTASDFEILLLEQALYANAYLDAWLATGDEAFAEIAREILTGAVRDLVQPETLAFSTSRDSDSLVPGQGPELRHGASYLWTREELRRLLDERSFGAITRLYGIEQSEGNVLRLARPDLLKDYQKEVEAARALMLDVRSKRPAPFRDEKVLAGANGLMISALVRGAVLLQQPNFIDDASAAARFVVAKLWNPSKKTLSRRWVAGNASIDALPEDVVLLVQGLLDLHQLTQEWQWLDLAAAINATSATTPVPASLRGIPASPDPFLPPLEPIATLNAQRIAELTGRATGTPALKQVVIAGDPHHEGTLALLGAAWRQSPRNYVLLLSSEGKSQERVVQLWPFAKDMRPLAERPAAWVCERGVCKPPAVEPEELAKLLR